MLSSSAGSSWYSARSGTTISGRSTPTAIGTSTRVLALSRTRGSVPAASRASIVLAGPAWMGLRSPSMRRSRDHDRIMPAPKNTASSAQARNAGRQPHTATGRRLRTRARRRSRAGEPVSGPIRRSRPEPRRPRAPIGIDRGAGRGRRRATGAASASCRSSIASRLHLSRRRIAGPARLGRLPVRPCSRPSATSSRPGRPATAIASSTTSSAPAATGLVGQRREWPDSRPAGFQAARSTRGARRPDPAARPTGDTPAAVWMVAVTTPPTSAVFHSASSAGAAGRPAAARSARPRDEQSAVDEVRQTQAAPGAAHCCQSSTITIDPFVCSDVPPAR